ncbi:rod shape-determining protein RodA, partial [Nonomuraea sp. NPDC001684]
MNRAVAARRPSLIQRAIGEHSVVRRMDGLMLVAVAGLCLIGTLLVWSSTRTWAPGATGLVKKHLLNEVIGVTLCAVVAMVDH